MAHIEQLEFCARVRSLFPSYFRSSRVLDVGSLDINGSNRQFFHESCKYVGLDVGPGRGVDVVMPVHQYDGANGSTPGAPVGMFETIISTECFEHDRHYGDSLRRIVDLLRPNGLFLFTCATTGRPEHGTSRAHPDDSPITSQLTGWSDFYKNLTEEDIRAEIDVDSIFRYFAFEVEPRHHDLYFWGVKRFVTVA